MSKEENNKEKEILKDLDFEPKSADSSNFYKGKNPNNNKKNNSNNSHNLHNSNNSHNFNNKKNPALIKANKKIDELIDELRHSKADFINYQNRTVKQMNEIKDDAYKQLLTEFFSILDDINAANDHKELKGPMEAIANKIISIFESKGVKRIGKIGDVFNPELYEAVMVENNESGTEQKVTKILQYGYMLNDLVIRPAKVAVS
jgi:molecular chaperone GrpE (heat shock protein)